MLIWNWGIGLAMGTAVFLYLRGWQQFTRQNHAPRRQPWRLASFLVAGVVLALALFSPLHHWATTYFYVHVLQRLLLVAVVPCLFFSGNPLPILYAGLPTRLQAVLVRLPQRQPRVYHFFTRLTSPLVAWFLFVATFWLWHDGQIDQLLLVSSWVHRLENVTLLGTAVGYWWHITNAAPRLHLPMPPLWRVGYAALGATPVKLVGLVLLFSSTAVYHYPAEITFYNLQITDQSLGAAIEWAVGGIVFTWTAVWLMRSWLKQEDDKPILPESAWATEAMMLAPGFGKQSSYAGQQK